MIFLEAELNKRVIEIKRVLFHDPSVRIKLMLTPGDHLLLPGRAHQTPLCTMGFWVSGHGTDAHDLFIQTEATLELHLPDSQRTSHTQMVHMSDQVLPTDFCRTDSQLATVAVCSAHDHQSPTARHRAMTVLVPLHVV